MAAARARWRLADAPARGRAGWRSRRPRWWRHGPICRASGPVPPRPLGRRLVHDRRPVPRPPPPRPRGLRRHHRACAATAPATPSRSGVPAVGCAATTSGPGPRWPTADGREAAAPSRRCPEHDRYPCPWPRARRAGPQAGACLRRRRGRRRHHDAAARLGEPALPRLLPPPGRRRRRPRSPPARTTHSPSRGDAVHYTVKAGGKELVDAAWQYPDSPLEELRDHVRFDWDALDAWFEEDEEVFVHPRSPYARVDILPSSRHVRVAHRRRGGGRHPPAVAAVRDRPARPLLPAQGRRADGPAGADRHRTRRARTRGPRPTGRRS